MHLGQQAALAAKGGSLLARIRRIVRPASVESPVAGWSLGIPALLTALALTAILHAQADDIKPAGPAKSEDVAKLSAVELAQRAAKDAQPWIDGMLQLGGAMNRSEAIAQMRRAIYSGEAEAQLAGLIAFDRVRSVKGEAGTSDMIRFAGRTVFDPTYEVPFDRVNGHDRFIELLKNAEPQIRAQAARCFGHGGERLDDLDIYLSRADDPSLEVREVVAKYFAAAKKRERTGGSGVVAIPSHASALKALLEKPRVTGEFRKSLEAILARCSARPAEAAQWIDLTQAPQVATGHGISMKAARTDRVHPIQFRRTRPILPQ